jgi:hypothetical protein
MTQFTLRQPNQSPLFHFIGTRSKPANHRGSSQIARPFCAQHNSNTELEPVPVRDEISASNGENWKLPYQMPAFWSGGSFLMTCARD